jgi:ABC-type dipeptide/oligopeptide/nickel transport system ATPase component
VSSLDVTNRELVLDLLKKLRNEYGLTIAVISHDLSVIATLCEETVVLEHGRVIEQGATSAVLGAPSEPYTQKLLRAVPRLPAM